MHDAQNVIDVLMIDRKPGIMLPQHKRQRIRKLHGILKNDHVIPVRHNIGSFLVREFEDIRNHLRLRLIDHALLMAFIQHRADLFLRHIPLNRRFPNAEQKQNSPCRSADDSCQRKNSDHQHMKYTAASKNPPLRMRTSKALGNLDAKDKKNIEHDQPGKNQRKRVSPASLKPGREELLHADQQKSGNRNSVNRTDNHVDTGRHQLNGIRIIRLIPHHGRENFLPPRTKLLLTFSGRTLFRAFLVLILLRLRTEHADSSAKAIYNCIKNQQNSQNQNQTDSRQIIHKKAFTSRSLTR